MEFTKVLKLFTNSDIFLYEKKKEKMLLPLLKNP